MLLFTQYRRAFFIFIFLLYIYNYTKLIRLGADDQPVESTPPTPKDPSEGGVWTLVCELTGESVKVPYIEDAGNWTCMFKDDISAIIRFSEDDGWMAGFNSTDPESPYNDDFGRFSSTITDTSFSNDKISMEWSAS